MLTQTRIKKHTVVFDFTSAGDFQQFTVPDNAVMLYIWAVGGGGNGGIGWGAAAGTARGGGGGGSAGAITNLVVPAIMLPKALYVQVGQGGQGANNGSSRVRFQPTSTIGPTGNLLHALSGNNGGAGSAGAGGLAGTAVSWGATVQPYCYLGTLGATTNPAGAKGGAQTGAVGTAITAFAGPSPISGGAGGGGCTTTDFAGGAVTSGQTADDFMSASQTSLGGIAVGGAGANGKTFDSPFCAYGGGGGGSNNNGVGGVGGKGGIGCGGGGGGAGTTGGTGGLGGNGRVIIVWW